MKEFLNGKTIQCTVVKSEQKQGPKAVFYVLSVEIADQLFPDESGKVVDCNSFRPCIEGKTYPFKFSITDKGGLMAERPKTTEDEKADQAKAQADAKAARLAKEAKEKADYEADQKARGMSDAPPQMAKDSTPSANLIPQTSANQVLLAKKFGFGDEDVRIMEQNNIIPKETPITQVEFFFRTAQLQGLNPLLKQIYLLPFGPAGNKSYATVTAIDSLRAKALQTGQYGGCTKVYFDGLPQAEWVRQYDNKRVFKTVETPKKYGQKTWTEKETFLESGDFPQIASITVTRIQNGIPCQFEAEIPWDEYYPGPSGRGQMWRDRPFGQLGKCVEAIALRKAFADSLSKMLIAEEIDRKAAQEDARDVEVEFVAMEDIYADLRNLHTTDQVQAYRKAHPEFEKDAEIIEAISNRYNELKAEA